jgi:nitroreductase
MDIFEAVDTRIACRWFHDKPVDLAIVKELIVKAQRAASGGNLQSWYVYALANDELKKFKRIAADRIAKGDPRHFQPEYPIYPEPMFGAYKERREEHGVQLYGSLGIGRDDAAGRLAQYKRNFEFFNAPVALRSTGGSAPASGRTSAATSTPSPIWRAATASTPARKRPGRGSTTPSPTSSSCRASRCCSAAWQSATATATTRPTTSARRARSLPNSARSTASTSRHHRFN